MVPNLSDKKLNALIKIIQDDVQISNDDEVELIWINWKIVQY